jgi:very-short-patch-repair endonuclease
MKLTSASEVKQLAKQGRKAQLEGRFLEAWNRLFPSLPRPVMQHKFHLHRKWRFDFSFIEERLAVEIDGGAFHGGAHGRGAQQSKDYEKMNTATAMGWRVLRFNTKGFRRPGPRSDVRSGSVDFGPRRSVTAS